MLARSGVEALHGRCMPNHGRGRIRAAALHAWHNQEDVPYQPLPTLTTHGSLFDKWSVGVLKDEMLVAGEKEIGGQKLPYIAQGEMSTSN